MKKHNLYTLFFLFIVGDLFSQSEEKYVINSCGTVSIISSNEIITSFGETVVSDDAYASIGFLYAFDTLYINSVDEVSENEIDFNYYPNPANDFINISAFKKINDIIIYDMLGKVVHNQKAASKNLTIDISNLSKGTYLLILNIDGEIRNRSAKITIQ